MECEDKIGNRIVNDYHMMKYSLKIHENIELSGSNGTHEYSALIDTGAEISMLTEDMAKEMGACRTDILHKGIRQVDECRENNMCDPYYYYGKIKILGKEIWFTFVVCKSADICEVPITVQDKEDVGSFEKVNHPIIGMSVLKELGIKIDTSKSKDALSL
jgi:predicted aspartyl protease